MNLAGGINLSLPYPVSANRYWRSYVPKGWTRALVVVSEDAKAYKLQAGWMAKAAGCGTPTTKPIDLVLKLYPKDGRRVDIDNSLKVVLDALKGLVYVDDKQIQKLSAEVMPKSDKPRLEVRFTEYIPPVEGLLL